jgi:outer membrane protein assembly factor BamB
MIGIAARGAAARIRAGANEKEHGMRFAALLVISLAALGPAACAPQAAPARCAGLALVQTIPLDNVTGRIDHMAADVKGRRLFVAEVGGGVDVVDLAAGKRAARLTGLREPQGVLYLPDFNRLVVACGGDGTVRFYDGQTLKPVKTVDLKDDADNLRYEAGARRVYVGYGNGAIAAVDPESGAVIADVKLNGHPESFQLERNGKGLFANVPAGKHVAVIDRDKAAVVATWPVKAAANFPMALDEVHGRLFVGCRAPARLLVYNTTSGEMAAEFPCAGDADDIFYDVAARRIYLSGGLGKLEVFDQGDADHYVPLGTIDTALGARTSLFVPELGRLYVAVPSLFGSARILVFQVETGKT